jgi:hypothetical protein
MLVFTFALRQKSNMRISVSGRNNSNSIHPVKLRMSSTRLIETLERVNSQAKSQHNQNAIRILAISRRNLRLALVSVASTFVAMALMAWVNMSAFQPDDSDATRTKGLMGRYIGAFAGLFDVIVNCFSILMMTSAWQPARVKTTFTQIKSRSSRFSKPNNNVKKEVELESEVSSLGGGH